MKKIEKSIKLIFLVLLLSLFLFYQFWPTQIFVVEDMNQDLTFGQLIIFSKKLFVKLGLDLIAAKNIEAKIEKQRSISTKMSNLEDYDTLLPKNDYDLTVTREELFSIMDIVLWEIYCLKDPPLEPWYDVKIPNYEDVGIYPAKLHAYELNPWMCEKKLLPQKVVKTVELAKLYTKIIELYSTRRWLYSKFIFLKAYGFEYLKYYLKL